MYKARMILALGTWLTILQYLGFPYAWRDVLTSLTGLILLYISYLLYLDYKKKDGKRRDFDSFRENNDFDEKESHEHHF